SAARSPTTTWAVSGSGRSPPCSGAARTPPAGPPTTGCGRYGPGRPPSPSATPPPRPDGPPLGAPVRWTSGVLRVGGRRRRSGQLLLLAQLGEHPGIAQGVGLDPGQVQELRHAVVVRPQQLGVDVTVHRGPRDRLEPVPLEEPD